MKKVIGAVAVLGILAALAVGVWKNMLFFTNTFDVKYLMMRGATIGGVLGLLIGWALFKSKADTLDSVERFQIVALPAVLLAMSFPVFAVWSNQALADTKSINKKVLFVKQEQKATSRSGVSVNGGKLLPANDALVTKVAPDLFYTYFTDTTNNNTRVERIRSEAAMYPNTAPATVIDLPIHKGFWGFDVVK
jgi:hypothetical protein